MARRKGEAHGDTLRVALLDAAGALLHAEGPQALTTRRLADAVGTSTQAIYTLFGGKEGIVRGDVPRGLRSARAVPRRRSRSLRSRPSTCSVSGARTAPPRCAVPHYYDVMFGRPVPEFEPTADDLERSLATQRVLTGGIARCIDSGMLRVDADPIEISAFLWAVAHGLVSLELTGHLDLGAADDASAGYDRYLMASVAAWLAT